MSAKRTEMHRLQELIRLRRMGQSQRAISGQIRMGRPTIRRYLKALEEGGVQLDSDEDLPAPAVLRAIVEKHLPAKEAPQQVSSVRSWESDIERLWKTGAGPTSIYDHLRLHVGEFSGSLSSVKRCCRRYKKAQGPIAADVAIPVDTVAGEVAQVDFGYVGMCYDKDRGVLRKAWLFVMSLGFSRHMYCDLVFDQKVETWCQIHIRAFVFFGGVPGVIVPDNLKSAVIRAAFGIDGDASLNRTYCELARHYDFRVDPAPPRAPKKKGKVERAILYVKGNHFATWETKDLQEDRKQLTRWNVEIAAKRIHGTTGKRPIDLFEEVEKAELKALPKVTWQPTIWKQATVHRDSHLQIDGGFYSVPWQQISNKLWVRCSPHSLNIYLNDEVLCSHPRCKRGERQLIESHLPEERRDLRFRSRSYWEKRAKRIGDNAHKLVVTIFESKDVLLQLRKVQGIVNHLEGFPQERANKAAARALHFGNLTYQSIKSILSKGLDYEALPGGPTRTWSQGSRYARRPQSHPQPKEIDNDSEQRIPDPGPQTPEALGSTSNPGPTN